MSAYVVLCLCLCLCGIQALPITQKQSEIQNVKKVVDEISLIAESLDTSASNSNVRVVRQSGGLMPYRYGYAVQDDLGNDFNQQEQSDGAQVTGQYSVLLPDGRVQTSTYSVAPDTGFVVEVAYSGGNGGVLLEGQVGK